MDGWQDLDGDQSSSRIGQGVGRCYEVSGNGWDTKRMMSYMTESFPDCSRRMISWMVDTAKLAMVDSGESIPAMGRTR